MPRACPPTILFLDSAETQCALPDYRPAVALAAAVVVALGCTVSAVVARRPATAQNRRNFRAGMVVAITGSVLGFVMMLALASGLLLGAPR